LRHAHGLTQRQIEEALDAQAELNGFAAEHLTAASLATCLTVPAHLRV
jgi:hypothetical protein